jgi:chromosomal replication initiator protein
MNAIDQKAAIWPLSLEQIEATVAAHLGPGRVPGNEQGSCFSRQMSMYLANRVGGLSITKIGRFYNGRHHSTVLHAIGKVERLREADESIDALVEVLIAAVSPQGSYRGESPQRG